MKITVNTHLSSKFSISKQINNGNTMWVCFEYLTKDNIHFWTEYVRSCNYYIEDMKKRGYNGKIPLSELGAGLSGMMGVINASEIGYKEDNFSHIHGISYITNVERKKTHTNNDYDYDHNYDYTNPKTHNETFGHIIMSVMLITAPKSCTVSHFGIFKNPIHLYNKAYSNLSLQLHSFSAKITEQVINKKIFPRYYEKWSNKFVDKIFMVNTPMKSMLNILKNKLPSGSISVGTNETLKNLHQYDIDEMVLVRQFPPRIFKNVDGEYEIINKQVKMDDLIDKSYIYDIKYLEPNTIPQKKIDFGGITSGSIITMIQLSALSNLY